MPFIQATTNDSKEIWKKGDRTIWQVSLDVGGQEFTAKTYSGAIATKGFSGELEAYEKVGPRGSDTFVRQKPKEGGGSYGGGATERDTFTMYLSYAKDVLIAMIETSGYDKAKFTEYLGAVSSGGKALYDARPNQAESNQAEPTKPADTTDTPDPFEGTSLPLELS